LLRISTKVTLFFNLPFYTPDYERHAPIVARSPPQLFLFVPCEVAERGDLGAVVAIYSFPSEAELRGARMLRTAMASAIVLEDRSVVEVMLNPDGRLWIDRLSSGLSDPGESLQAADGERIMRLVAHYVGAEVRPNSPRISAELSETGERFAGLLPPVVVAPVFVIRKAAVAVFGLDDYIAAAIMNLE